MKRIVSLAYGVCGLLLNRADRIASGVSLKLIQPVTVAMKEIKNSITETSPTSSCRAGAECEKNKVRIGVKMKKVISLLLSVILISGCNKMNKSQSKAAETNTQKTQQANPSPSPSPSSLPLPTPRPTSTPKPTETAVPLPSGQLSTPDSSGSSAILIGGAIIGAFIVTAIMILGVMKCCGLGYFKKSVGSDSSTLDTGKKETEAEMGGETEVHAV